MRRGVSGREKGREGEWRGGGRERERDPECCQFAALIFQLWSVRLERRRWGSLQSSLRGTTPYLLLLCLAVQVSRLLAAPRKNEPPSVRHSSDHTALFAS